MVRYYAFYAIRSLKAPGLLPTLLFYVVFYGRVIEIVWGALTICC